MSASPSTTCSSSATGWIRRSAIEISPTWPSFATSPTCTRALLRFCWNLFSFLLDRRPHLLRPRPRLGDHRAFVEREHLAAAHQHSAVHHRVPDVVTVDHVDEV